MNKVQTVTVDNDCQYVKVIKRREKHLPMSYLNVEKVLKIYFLILCQNFILGILIQVTNN